MFRFGFPWFNQHYNLNRNGIAEIESTGVSVGTEAVTFTFSPEYGREASEGLLIVDLVQDIPSGATATLPIRFTMAGATASVVTYNGDPWTVADVPGTGAYLFKYNRRANTLQVLMQPA